MPSGHIGDLMVESHKRLGDCFKIYVKRLWKKNSQEKKKIMMNKKEEKDLLSKAREI